jgi:amino acid adenylation domain-containing protein
VSPETLEGYRLSPEQSRMWTIQRAGAPGCVGVAIRIEGPLRPAAFRRAAQSLVARHEILRTRFVSLPGMTVPLQVIGDNLALEPTEMPFSATGTASIDEAIDRTFAVEGERLLRENTLPVSVTLLQVADTERLAVVTVRSLSADTASLDSIAVQLAELYEQECTGIRRDFETLQYADVSEWRHELLESESGDAARSYWRDIQRRRIPPLELPFERPSDGPAVIGVVQRAMAGDAVDRVAQELPLPALLLGAWHVLMWRMAKRREFVMAWKSSGRKLEESAAAIGLFEQWLPVVVRARADVPFCQFARAGHEAVVNAERYHEFFSWEQFEAEASGVHRPYPVTTGFAWEDWPPSRHANGVTFTVIRRMPSPPSFPIALFGSRRADDVYLEWVFDSSRLVRGDVQVLADRYLELVARVIKDPTLHAYELDVLLPSERRHLNRWNRTTVRRKPGALIHDRFALLAARTPGACAVDAGVRQISYAELEARSNQLAWWLREHHVGPEQRVALFAGRSIEMVVGFLAILKAGGVYVPIDAKTPLERASALVEASGATVLLFESRLGRVRRNAACALALDSDWNEVAAYPDDPPNVPLQVRNAAYIIYTSGSTGRPKGVTVEHGSLLNLACALKQRVYRGERRRLRIAVNASIAFDASIKQFVQLAFGHTLVLVPDEIRADPAALLAYLREHAVDVLDCTPSMLRELLAVDADGAARWPCLVLVGGEAVDSATWTRCRSKASRFVNVYGPTECTVDATCVEICDSDLPTIGHPLGNVRTHVLDSDLCQVPVGVEGELFIGGECVSRGYDNAPALSAERFVPDPFAADAGARLYRSGDIVRRRLDGALEFLGRTDRQIKLRGFRIEPSEIEAALLACPGVKQAACLLREDQPGVPQLVAYVVPDGASPPHPVGMERKRSLDPSPPAIPDHLRDSLQQHLPDYMVPATVVLISELPLTRNGKVDLRALPAPETVVAEADFAAPRTPIEEIVANIWAHVLQVPAVGRHANFFELGGHSLLATQVIARVRRALGVEVSLRALFDAPTVAGLSSHIAQASPSSPSTAAPLRAGARPARVPLSFAQQRLWFLSQLEPESVAYHSPLAVRLTGRLDVAAVEFALNAVVERHEVLRTTFPTVDGTPVQAIAPALGVPVRLVDLTGVDDAEAAARHYAARDARRPFDLANGPLVRATLMRLAPDTHLFVLTLHHVVADGWSLGVLAREFGQFYTASRQRSEVDLPPLPIQYADYAVWQQEWLQGEVLDAELEYWERQLAGAPVLDLPSDRLRPAAASHRGASRAFVFPADLSARLEAFSRAHGLTLFMTLLAGLQTLLARYTGQHDVAVGTAIANRTREETEGLIGFFVNELVLRTSLGGNPSFSVVAERVRQTVLDAYVHQDVPFEKIVERLAPARDLGRSPLFQVLFVLQNAPRDPVSLPGLEARHEPLPSIGAKYELLVTIDHTPGGLSGALEYASDLFDDARMVRLAADWQRLLDHFTRTPDLPIHDVSLLEPAERHEVLEVWNATAAVWTVDLPLHEHVEAQVRRSPDAVAVVDEQQQITYAELNDRSEALARHLRTMGVVPDRPVAVCLERSVEMVIAILAVIKAGGAYVPIDPADPIDRVDRQLDDAGVSVILTTQAQAGLLPLRRSRRFVCLDQPLPQGFRAPRDQPKTKIDGDNLAYVIYTSGSTGRPKGVMNTHAGVCNRLLWMQARYELGPHDRVLQKTPYTFDVSVWEFFWPLMCGSMLVLARPGGHRDPSYLVDHIVREQITVAHFVPSMLKAFLQHPLAHTCISLRDVMASGEALDAGTRSLWFSRFRAGLHNLYGPTEAAIDVSHWTCASDQHDTSVPIGHPIANTRLYVVDEWGEPVPVGTAGELYIGGAGVARGYLGQPGLTAARFVPDPFSATPGARLYRTGDRVRWRADGELEFLGRLDHQVKVRGYRIELGEIEAVLGMQSGVGQAVAAVQPTARGDAQVVAYVVAAPGAVVEGGALRAALQRRLPEYMVPAVVLVLPALPLTPSGKVDRRALPVPEACASAPTAMTAPQTPVEEIVANIWADVLQVPSVGRDANFFELGGHSLLATQVVARLRRALGVEVSLRALFEAPTVARLAAHVPALRPGGPAAPPLVAGVRPTPVPLSFAQQRLWFLDQWEPGTSAYNVPLAVRLTGPVSVPAVAASLELIAQRHEVLRTTFPVVDGAPVQAIAAQAAVPVSVVDLTGVGAGPALAQRWARREARRPFTLARGPLLRAVLLRLGPEEHVLVVTLHHIVSDGWSLGVLVREFNAAYTAWQEGRPAALPPLPVHYADYAVWQRQWLQGTVLEAQLQYWARQLADLPVLDLPTDRPRPAVATQRGATVTFPLPAELTARLRAFSQAHGATLFMTLLTGLKFVLAHHSGEYDIAVGTSIAGRTRQEVEPLIGFFVNELVLRTDISGPLSFSQAVARVRQTVLDAYAHQEVPFELVVERLAPERDPGRSPLFQVLFVMQNVPSETLAIPGLTLQPASLDAIASKFDLTFNVRHEGEALTGTLVYDSDLFDADTIRRLADHLTLLLESACASPDAPIAALWSGLDPATPDLIADFCTVDSVE